MASDEPAHRRNTSAHAIPLQDLDGNGAQQGLGVDSSASHRRTLSDRGRAMFQRHRESVSKKKYAPINARSPSPPSRVAGAGLTSPIFVTSPTGQHKRIPDEDDEAGYSPVGDRGAFQAAIGFAGLSFNADRSSPEDEETELFEETPPRPAQQRASRTSLPSLRTSRDDMEMMPVSLDDGPAFFSPGLADEEDTQPLTSSSRPDMNMLAAPSTPQGQSHDRHSRPRSRLSARFSRGHSRSGSRLGDELHDLEAHHVGHDPSSPSGSRSPSSRKRSISPTGSPLHRSATMLRKMSQRVVNVSHESELLERSLQRRPSAQSAHSNSGIVPPVPPLPSVPKDGIEVDGTPAPRSPASEKAPSLTVEPETPKPLPVIDRNPLRGRSLGVFPPESRMRRRLLGLLVHPLFEPFILLLIVIQTVILAVDASGSVYTHPRPTRFGNHWTDYVILAIFFMYTVEIAVKIVVSGFIFNPREYSTIDRSVGLRKALLSKANDLFTLHRKPTVKGRGDEAMVTPAPSSLLRTFTTSDFDEIPGGSRQAQKKRLAYRAFLRHSFNRLDFLAVVSFWISFVLAISGIESHHHIWVFRMLSCLRILRLLFITSGTSVILRSLKRAAPTLLNVAFLIGFFWLLFAIIGVQSFKSSLRRTCVWNWDDAIDFSDPSVSSFSAPGAPSTPPLLSDSNAWAFNQTGNYQFCGGWMATNGSHMPWLALDGGWGDVSSKGFLCPEHSFCIESGNPYNGTVSFDNILQSIEMVFVVMTSNTFTDIMYYLTMSDYLAAAIFMAFGIVILTFWLISLLIAVITSSFQVIREETASSAFMAIDHDPSEEAKLIHEHKPPRRMSGVKRLYRATYWLWIVVIVYALLVQCFRTDVMGSDTANFINTSELVVTLVLLVEIFFRFVSDWRDFRHHRRNWVDLGLAIITAMIQIPAIRNSGQPYAWLTVFQILRIYRVVLAVKITRDLITLVLRHVSGILNLILFVFLLTFLASIFAVQLFRGELYTEDVATQAYTYVTFATIYNAFLGMYQVLSSENWTTIVYNVTRWDAQYGTAWIGAGFFIIWFTLGYFITLNMFIAVIQENFDVSEDQKRLQQVRMFLQQKELGSSSMGTLSLSTIFKFGYAKRQDPLDFGSAATEMLLKDAVVRDFLDEQLTDDAPTPGVTHSATTFVQESSGWLEKVRDWVTKRLFNREPNPFYARLQLTKAFEELDPRTLAKEVMSATEQRKVTQREYLRRHPTYNVSLYIFQPNNPFRRFCQRIVGPGRGDRIQGVQPNPRIWYMFSAFIYAAIVAMVLLACVTTPLFQMEYFGKHGFRRINWFVLTDLGFAALFTIEAIIKVIADGFFWTPNAYFRSSWGFIDGIVLFTLWINVITALYAPDSGSRAVGAFKALRALRLLNVSDSTRDTFHSVIVLGGWKVVSAAFVSLSLLIPFAIYGLNLFAGQMQRCNDFQDGLYNLTDCVGEYNTASPFGWNIIAPRQVTNSYFNFDNFGSSLFILFQIVSQEGWIDVETAAESITGVFTQPNPSSGQLWSSQGNAIFFVIFNLLGAVFVLTLFVSVFMRNYAEQTGVAFLTAEQRSWLELRKLLRQVAPSKRPNTKRKREGWQEWCYRRAITKNGRWQRTMTAVLIVHLILLCSEYYPEPAWWTMTRDIMFLVFTVFYIVNVIVRMIGLSWTRFRKSAWDVYSVVAVGGTTVMTILLFSNRQNRDYIQIHKLFLVSIALMLIPRNNQLDQLFKTAAASLSGILNLLCTWFVLFLVYAIALTQTFGLTRFGTMENVNLNFRTVPKALIVLFRMSVGEGWNQIMYDFSYIQWPRCTIGNTYFEGDCGSPDWARALFISWNILSMYIFVNLFISLIYESFSYVYQRSSGLSIISREEIRRFKQAWAEFDPNGTGYITKEVFPRFLGELSGVFEMRIYDGDFSVRALIEDCKLAPVRTSALPVDGTSGAYDIDLDKLNRRLSDLPVDEVRKRRARMNTFYEEVLVSADPDRGISFNGLLMVLAHYKVINDNKSLKLEEFLRRRARLQRVEEAVHRNIVVGFFDTLYWSRRFRRAVDTRKNARITEFPSLEVPEIFVQGDDDDVTQAKKFDIPSVAVTPVDYDPADTADSLGIGRAPTSGSDVGTSRSALSTVVRNRSGSIQHSDGEGDVPEPSGLSPRHRPSASTSSIQPDWHFAAAIEQGVSPPVSPRLDPTTIPDAGARSRANSAVSQSEMLGMFQDSAWGESMRRSVTQRRPSDHGRPSS